jgi:uncharacterized protein YpmB
MTKNIIIISLFLGIAINMSSCRLFKKHQNPVVKTEQNISVADTSREAMPLNNHELVDLLNQDVHYQWLSTRIRAEIGADGEQQKATIFLVNRKDSLIYINISKFGIEGARAVITKDSVKYMNRLEMTYYVGDYSIFYKMFGVHLNFNMMQSLILACDFTNFDKPTEFVEKDGKLTFTLTQRKHRSDNIRINQNLVFSKDLKKVLQNEIEDARTMQKAIVQYVDFQEVDKVLLPLNWNISVPGANLKATFVNESLRLNVPGPTSIRIPDRYKPINFGTDE